MAWGDLVMGAHVHSQCPKSQEVSKMGPVGSDQLPPGPEHDLVYFTSELTSLLLTTGLFFSHFE